MGRPTKLTRSAIGLAISMAAARPTLAADSDPGRRARAVRVSQQELLLKINQLQEQNRTLEIHNNRAIQQQLSTQQQEIDGIGASDASDGATCRKSSAAGAADAATAERCCQEAALGAARGRLSDGDGPNRRTECRGGGMYYAAFLNHRFLLTHEDEAYPGGFISGEMLVGWDAG